MKRLALLILLAASRLAAVDLSDAFGYHLTSQPFAYTDISGSGTPVSLAAWVGTPDDGYFQLNLPFNFQFYAAPFNKVSISSNGYLQFGSTSSSFSSNCLVANVPPSNIVAAYWMDLNPGLSGSVRYQFFGSPGSRTAVVQFTNVPPNLGPGSASFQVLLYEGSNNIEIRYLSTSTHDSGASASSGLRGAFDCPNHTSLPFSCHTPMLTDGLDLLFAYPAIEPLCGTPTMSPTFSISPTFSLTLTSSMTSTITPTFSISPSPSATPSPSPTGSGTASPSASPTASPSPSASPTSTVSPTLSASRTASASPSPTRTAVVLSDLFGYSASSAPFAWVDISGSGTTITAWAGGSDDGSFIFSFPVGMTFRFYGASYDKVAISSNGYLQFGSASSNFGNNCLNTNVSPTNIIALFWQDLNPGAGGGVFAQVLGSPGSRTAVIQFEQVPLHSGPGVVSAEAILYESSGRISLLWKDSSSVLSGANAVTGLRSLFDCPNRTSLPLSCNAPVISSLSQVDFSYPSPEPACGTMTQTPTFSITRTVSSTFTISPTFTASPTITATPTISSTFTLSPSFSVSPTISGTFTISPTHSVSPTISPTFSISQTFTVSETWSMTPTISPSPSITGSPSLTATISQTPSITPTVTTTGTATSSPTISPSFTRSPTLTVSATATPSATRTASPSATPTATPSATKTVTSTYTVTMSFTASPSYTRTPTSTATLYPAAPKPACAVLGEPDFTASSGMPAGASSLALPSGVALDASAFPYRLYIADAASNRILVYNDAGAIAAGGPADGVIGQADFLSVAANRGGGPGANTLSGPQGIDVDPSSGDLWVCDSGNSRVLRFSAPIPLFGASASRVLGQGGSLSSAGPNNGGISARSLANPKDLSIDANRHMAVADTGNHRALRFDLASASDAALSQWGQADFVSALPNRGGGTAVDSLLSPAGVALGASDLWVSDTGNHRITRYGLTFITPTAAMQLGQSSFSASLANQGFAIPGGNSLNAPRGMSIDAAQRLYVADSLNHRILAYDPPYAPNASYVWGQSGMSSNAPACQSDRMNAPLALKANVSGNLAIADSLNRRLLFYGCSSGVGAATATPSITLTGTPTATRTATPSVTPTSTISATYTATLTASPSPTFSDSPTRSLTPSFSPTITLTATVSPTPSVSSTPSVTLTATLTRTPYVPPTLTPYPHPKDGIVSYPNPALKSSGGACLAFPAGGSAKIAIYDLWLQEVRRLDSGAINPAAGTACWNLRNQSGEALAPGIYYIRVVVDGKSYLGKMTVI